VSEVTAGGANIEATALEFGDDGILYTVPNMSDALFGRVLTIDPLTALATDLGDTGLTAGPVALTFMGSDIMSDGFETGTTFFWSETVE
jgi:hypothetical protein